MLIYQGYIIKGFHAFDLYHEIMSNIEILRLTIHYGLHFLLPGLIAYIFFKSKYKIAWLIMLLAMLIDLDHLFANPIFDSNRCSIGFHYLHTYYAIIGYFALLVFPKLRIISAGLIIHVFVDFLDCILTTST